MFVAQHTIQPGELARELEARGFESLWLPEHTHIPASRRTPWPGGPELPKHYAESYDPFIALTAAAAATTTLRLATGICLLVERDPITTAKEIATLDQLSAGRFIFGVGGGWNAEEMADHGTEYRTRWRLLRERVLAMKAIWTDDEAEFHGEFVNFDKLWAWPKPAQQPHPPIMMGGDGQTTHQRVIEYADGWMPIWGRPAPGPTLPEKMASLRSQAADAGKPRPPVSVFQAPATAETVKRLEDWGVDRAIFNLPVAGRDTVLTALDEYAKLMR
jgi:probable F420-dependent oxidoreductase